MTTPAASRRIDIMIVLRQLLAIFWLDFGPIVLLGLGLLALPTLLSQALLQSVGTDPQSGNLVDPSLATIVQTADAVLMMVYVCVVTYGVLARLSGRPLDANSFIRSGLRAAQPGVLVALVLGALAMGVNIVRLLASSADLIGGIIALLCYGVIIWGLATWLPAVPAAIVERASPIAALKRAADLTRGQRGRLIGLLLVLGIALLPVAMIMTMVLFGTQPDPHIVAKTMMEWSVLSPGLWIMLLLNVLITGLIAPLPAIIYARLIH